MAYFPESTIITTVDGIQFKTFSNEHPEGFLIAKPKYIPTEEIFCDKLQLRTIFDKQVNRLDMWIEKQDLKYYLDAFKRAYPYHLYHSDLHKNWFFAIPKKSVKQIFDPKEGLKSITKLSKNERDEHLDTVINFVEFILESGVKLDKLGITFSTLAGHYDPKYSDINLVIYGKDNGWKVINFLKNAQHPSLKWKNEKEWEEFRQKRNRKSFFTKEEFFEQNSRKATEGFFNNKLFLLLPVEEEKETWEKWGAEQYTPLGIAEIEAVVTNNHSSIVRPGLFEVKNSKSLSGKDVPVNKIVSYSRDYVAQAFPGEKLRAKGLLEEVKNIKTNKISYRVVIGYFDSYTTERREQEYIKKL